MMSMFACVVSFMLVAMVLSGCEIFIEVEFGLLPGANGRFGLGSIPSSY
jgi:hypothetical protein